MNSNRLLQRQRRRLSNRSERLVGRRYVNRYSPRNRKKIKSKFFYKLFALILVTSVLYLSFKSVFIVSSYNDNLTSVVNEVDSSCKSYKKISLLNSFININLKSDKKLNSISYIVYDEVKAYEYDLNHVEFFIDKGVTKGKFSDYYDNNLIYLENSKVLKSLSRILLKEFYLKADYLIITEEENSFERYLKYSGANISSKIISNENVKSLNNIKTNLCKEDWNKFVSDINPLEIHKVKFDPKKKITEYFYMSPIKREQVRIHIHNSTGVEKWGNYAKRLYENYGLNVVKVDFSNEVKTKSSIYLDGSELANSYTVTQVIYLSQQELKSLEVSIKDTIFADIYIDMGQDWLTI